MTVPDETEDKNGNLHGLSLIIMYLVLPKAQALSFYSSRSCAGSFYAIDVIILLCSCNADAASSTRTSA